MSQVIEMALKPIRDGQASIENYFVSKGLIPTEPVIIHGQVSPGFEEVKEIFAENFRLGHERKAQLCVYIGEEKIIDLWASANNDPDFGADKLMNVFSSTKCLSCIALAKLLGTPHPRGINYSSKISEVWPQFKGNGKETALIKDLMRHELGMPTTDAPIDPNLMKIENIKMNKIGEILERHPLQFQPGTKRDYHFVTRGLLLNEIFRRLDSKGRTVGQYLREEISSELEADALIGGLTEEECKRTEDLEYNNPIFSGLQSLLPAKARAPDVESVIRSSQMMMWPMLAIGHGIKKLFTLDSNSSWFGPEPIAGVPAFRFDKLIENSNSKLSRTIESPSVNGYCSGRGLAKLAGAMANKGKLGGVEVLSEKAWEALHANPKPAKIGLLPSNFTEGGVNIFEDLHIFPEDWGFKGREGFIGWMGLGGSVFQWHPDHQIGFGYSSNLIDFSDMNNNKGLKLQKCVVKCLIERNNNVKSSTDSKKQ